MWQRLTAQRLLVERGKTDVVAAAGGAGPRPQERAGRRSMRCGPCRAWGRCRPPRARRSRRQRRPWPTPTPACAAPPWRCCRERAEGVAAVLAAKSAERPGRGGAAGGAADAGRDARLGGSRDRRGGGRCKTRRTRPTRGFPRPSSPRRRGATWSSWQPPRQLRPAKGAESLYTNTIRVVAEHVARQAADGTPAKLLAVLKSADPASVEPLLAGLAAGWPAADKPNLDERPRPTSRRWGRSCRRRACCNWRRWRGAGAWKRRWGRWPASSARPRCKGWPTPSCRTKPVWPRPTTC